MNGPDVEVITTAHWEGDPRLNRHVRYLTEGGRTASLTSYANSRRIAAVGRTLVRIIRSKARVVILPDPEMFLPGGLAARLSRKRPIIDIHESYTETAMERAWVPGWARIPVRVLAGVFLRAGRVVAWRVLVAAPELARSGDYVSLNLPNPASLHFSEHDGSYRLVYVGDLTRARGAISMVEVIPHLDEDFELVMIGGVSEEELRDEIEATAERHGVADRVHLTGRMGHEDAWNAARGALAGLNLLNPAPAYRDAVATKLWEYMAVGLPPIVSELPGQAALVTRIDEDLVCGSPAEAAAIASALGRDPDRRAALAATARKLVEEAWADNRPDLVVQAVVEP